MANFDEKFESYEHETVELYNKIVNSYGKL